VLFPRASYTLSDSGKRFLSLFGQALRNALKNVENHPEIQVQGHTDTRRWDNWMLSMNRALAVIKVFSEQTNLRRTHLSAAGYS
jgi:flagellar motor protein MotB